MRTVDSFQVGERVVWVQDTGYGLRYDFHGRVEKIGAKKLTIKLDHSSRPVQVFPHNVRHESERT
jgi:hypothetical protein